MSDEKMSKVLASGAIRTPKGRISYPYLFEPNQKQKTQAGKPKYSVSILIPPGSDLTAMKAAAAEKVTEKWGASPGKVKSPFLDAFEKTEDEKFKGWTLVRMWTTQQPSVILGNLQNAEPKDCYPGRWAYISCNPGAYLYEGLKGVSFYVNHVQLLDHDEPLAGRARVEDDFVAVGDAEAPATVTPGNGGGLFD